MPYLYTSADVSDYLDSIGVTLDASFDLAGELDAVKDDWLTRTGRDFFVSDPDATVEQRYDPPMQGAGRIYIRDMHTVSAVTMSYSGVGTGYELTEDEHFVLVRWRQNNTSTPVVAIDFFMDAGVLQRSILVEGKLGFATTIPAGVWRAIIEETAMRAIEASPNSEYLTKRMKQGGREIEFDTERRRQRERFNQKVSSYTRHNV